MNKVSFEEIGAVAATFFAQKEVKAGQVVKMTGNGQVGPCSAGDKFCGVAMEPRKGGAAVQVKGFVTVSCTGSLTPGWAVLEADGSGGVQTAAEGGQTMLVVAVDETAETVTVKL